MSRFDAAPTPLGGLTVVRRQLLGDHRGFLARMFCAETFRAIGFDQPVAQINHTYTQRQGTVRGLHYQHPPHAEIKLVSCIRGAVWDVAVDLRRGSPTFLQWHAQVLSADNALAMLIPAGFAHGFQSMSDDAELLYCHSAAYDASAEAGLHPGDERLAITWPLPMIELSARDAGHARITAGYQGLAT